MFQITVLHATLLGIFRKLCIRRGAPIWFETVWSYTCGSYGLLNHFVDENYIVIWGCSWCCWKGPRWVRFSRVYFTVFRELRCGKYLIFEWILLLEIQNNLPKLGLEQTKQSVELTMCSHCQIYKFTILLKKVKIKECVHSLGQKHRLTLVGSY
jgi:hypothetical protein